MSEPCALYCELTPLETLVYVNDLLKQHSELCNSVEYGLQMGSIIQKIDNTISGCGLTFCISEHCCVKTPRFNLTCDEVGFLLMLINLILIGYWKPENREKWLMFAKIIKK